MIKKYLVKPSPTDQAVGVMHFVEQARLKIGGNKSASFTIEYVFLKITGECAKDVFHVGNGKIMYVHDAKSVQELTDKVDAVMEELASEAWYVYRPKSLGRVMR